MALRQSCAKNSILAYFKIGGENELVYSIYSIKCLTNNKVYFGRTQEVEKRWRSHKNSLKRSIHNNTLLQQDWNKFGEEMFKFEVLRTTTVLNEAIILEQKYIESKNYDKYNISDARMGGDTFTNNPRKEETRKIKTYQNTGDRNPMYGKAKSEKMLMRVKEANSKPVTINGVTYASITVASKETGINRTTINYRLNSLSPQFKDWNYTT